jgi:hypothetical protein
MWVQAGSLVAVNVSRKWRCSQAERFMISSRYTYDEEWDDICTAMAWIREGLGLVEEVTK